MEKSSYNLVLFIVGLLIQEYSFVKSFSLISKTKVKITLITLIAFFVIAFFQYINSTYNYIYFKPIVSFILLTVLNIIIFRKNIKNIFICSLILNILIGFLDILYTVITFRFLPNIILFDNNYYIKVLYTILVSLSTLLIVRIFNIIIRKKKYKYLLDKKMIINLILLAVLLNGMVFKYVQNMSKPEYIINIFVILIAISIISMNFYQFLKVKKAEEKEIALIEFMTEYEKIIDDNRIIKHEMLNNLLIIKSLINSKPKRLEETLDQIIKEYDNKSNSYKSGLYNLPTGLKGLVYYKIYNLKNNNAKINIFIPKITVKIMDEIKNKIYLKVYKILGILLDNAVEACIESNEKFFILDIYEEKDKLCFYIENSTKNKIDITKIKQKGYSTKGKNRGLGLYVVSNILEKSEEFELNQHINGSGHFVSILIVKK